MPLLAASAAPQVTTVVRADPVTGKLRRVIATPAGPPAERESLNPVIDRIAREQGVETPLVHSIIQAETNYAPTAVSPKGAEGIMQLIPATARRFGVSNSFDPEANIEGGVKYLRFLLDYYHGDYARAIAAYNAGEEAVNRYDGVPPYPETQKYVNRVAKRLTTERARQSAQRPAAAAPAGSGDAKPAGETGNPIQASVGSDGRIYYRTP